MNLSENICLQSNKKRTIHERDEENAITMHN